MAKKSDRSKKDVLIEDLSTQIKKLSKQVRRLEKERDELVGAVDQQRKKAIKAVRKVEKRARKEIVNARERAETATESAVSTILDHAPRVVTDGTAEEVEVDDPQIGNETPLVVGPDSSWTVVDLRAVAKKREVAGYSRMSKAQLLAALT